jgi:DNA repair exonuclease SbcCD nuclease subunit
MNIMDYPSIINGVRKLDKAYVVAVISDIHFGAMPIELLLNELQIEFLDYLDKLAVLDAVVITGDIYDQKLSLNSIHVKASFEFLRRLIEICKNKGSKLRIIEGTKSHDNNQLESFGILTRVNADIKIISTIEKEMLFDNLHVLYLPEEYINDMDYYKEYLSDRYDMAFGHGLFTEVAFVAKEQESEVTHSKAPIFNSIDFIKCCYGPVFFGHIHTKQIIKDKIFYVGSFSRWCYGEEAPKGFYICAYSPINKNFKVDFIENAVAIRYDTVKIFPQVGKPFSIEELESFVKELGSDHLRMIIIIPDEYENPSLLANISTEFAAKYKNVKVIVKNSTKEKQKKEMDKKINELIGKYGFVFDKSLAYEDKISRFIKEKYNKNISVDRIKFYLYEQVLK